MSVMISGLFVLACLAGGWAARRGHPTVEGFPAAIIGVAAALVLIAALIGTAESSDAVARWLGFAAIIVAAAASVAGFTITERRGDKGE